MSSHANISLYMQVITGKKEPDHGRSTQFGQSSLDPKSEEYASLEEAFIEVESISLPRFMSPLLKRRIALQESTVPAGVNAAASMVKLKNVRGGKVLHRRICIVPYFSKSRTRVLCPELAP